jgi:hypothetical protein
MAVTRLKRKDRYNKTVSRLKQQNKKLVIKQINVRSPYKEQTGVVED